MSSQNNIRQKNKPEIAIVVTTPLIVRFFLYCHIEAMTQHYHVVLFTTIVQADLLDCLPDEVEIHYISIKREITPFYDMKAFFELYRGFRKKHFFLVHSVTPKAGFLSMLAGRLARIPHRLHTFTGQVWVTRQGFSRWFLKKMDKFIAFNATAILVDSPSQKDYLVDQHIVSPKLANVLEEGSISGVDLARFYPDNKKKQVLREDLGIPSSSVVLLYVGRLKRDKGVIDLAQAFLKIIMKSPDTFLVFVGPDEENLSPLIKNVLNDYSDKIRMVPYTKNPEHYMMMADIFCLPSYREGFGTVVIEAAACGIPAVASKIYGLTDAIVDGETGLLVTKEDVDDLTVAIIRLVEDVELRNTLGQAARYRVVNFFSQKRLTDALLLFYSKLKK